MRSRKRIIIELTPAGIDGAVIRFGRVVRSAHIPIEPTDWRQAWEEGLSPFDGALGALIAALEAPGAGALVAYRSPTSFAEIITVPVTGSAVAGAARLALADSVGFDLQRNPYSIEPITTAVIKGARSTHTLAIADSSDVSESLTAWLGRAGCRLAGACPGSALTLTDAVNGARRDGAGSTVAGLYFDRYCSLLTVASGGEVRLVRRIDIGFEDFVSAITRPIERRDAPGEAVTLSPSMARKILCVSGIPDFKASIEGGLGLTGRDILPLIQPALQRLGIEIKQSFRFELSPEERAAITLTCAGPFGALSNLDSAIAEQTEIVSVAAPASALDAAAVESPFLGDPDRAARLAQRSSTRTLVSERITAGQRVDSIRIGVRAGAIAAALALVALAMFTGSQTRRELDAAKGLNAAVETVNEIIAINGEIQSRSDTLAATSLRMQETIGLTTRWSDALSALPGLIPGGVTLIDIEGAERSEQAPARIDLSGIARDEDERTSQAALNEFIDALNACPLVSGVELGVTNRIGNGSATEAMRFSVTINLVSLPRQILAGAGVDAGASEGATR